MKRFVAFFTSVLVLANAMPLGVAEAYARDDVVVSAFFADPVDVSDGAGEWLEITNQTDQDIDLTGWRLTDEENDNHVIRSEALDANGEIIGLNQVVLPARETITLCRNADATRNGGVICAYEYGAEFQMKNSGDSLVVIASDEKETDRVEYAGYWVVPGAVTALSDLSLDNGTFRNWAFFTIEKPVTVVAVDSVETIHELSLPDETPPAATATSPYPQTATAGDVIVTEFMADPTDVSDDDGEWIEIYNATNHTINLNGWILSDEEGQESTVSVEDGVLPIHSGEYVTLCRNNDYLKNGGVACAYEYGKGFQMKNDGGRIVLADAAGTVTSRVYYSGFWVKPGITAALKDVSVADSAFDHWTTETNTLADAAGHDLGTPGRANAMIAPEEIAVKETLVSDFAASLPANATVLGTSGVRVGDLSEAFGEATQIMAPIDVTLQQYVEAGQPVDILGWDTKKQEWERVGDQENLKGGQLKISLAHATTLAFVSRDVLAPYLFEVVMQPSDFEGGDVIDNAPATPETEAQPEVESEPTVIATAQSVFKDVSPLFWAYDYIKALKEAGVMEGYSDGRFGPHRFVNRAEMAKISLKAFNQKPHVGMTAKFRDISADSWYSPFAEKARLLGVIVAENNRFEPERAVTRAEALAMVLRSSLLKPNPAYFDTVAKDVHASDWFYGYVRFAEGAGIIDRQVRFNPNEPASRAEVAAITARARDYARQAKSEEKFSGYDQMKTAMGIGA